MDVTRQGEIIRNSFRQEMAAIDRQGANKDAHAPSIRLAHGIVKDAARQNSRGVRCNTPSEREELLARNPSSERLLQRYESTRADPADDQLSGARNPTFDRQVVEGLAHDIKNPLVIVSVHAQLLASQFGRDADEQQKQDLLIGIQDNVKRVLKLIEAFLAASAIEKGKAVVVRQPVQLNHLIREAAQQQIELIDQKKIALRLNLDDRLAEIMGDDFQLHRVLSNLIGNAVKFTPTGGAIGMSSRVADGQVCFDIENTGAGIPEAELNTIFEECRTGASAHPMHGNGLGLYIVKTIVAAHRGTVQAKSQLGAGMIVTLSFPVRE